MNVRPYSTVPEIIRRYVIRCRVPTAQIVLYRLSNINLPYDISGWWWSENRTLRSQCGWIE